MDRSMDLEMVSVLVFISNNIINIFPKSLSGLGNGQKTDALRVCSIYLFPQMPLTSNNGDSGNTSGVMQNIHKKKGQTHPSTHPPVQSRAEEIHKTVIWRGREEEET
jgi:Zn-dependent protease with chaperone function